MSKKDAKSPGRATRYLLFGNGILAAMGACCRRACQNDGGAVNRGVSCFVFADMIMMFSNRWWMVKVVGAAVLLIAFGYLCQRRYGYEHPDFWICRLNPDQSRGKKIITGQDMVTAVGNGEFEIEEEGYRIRVRNPSVMPAVGDTVTVAGTFDGDSLLPSEVRIHPHFKIKRGLMYGISLATVAVLFILFARRYRNRLHEGLFVARKES